jgi:hypothetical protein
MLSRLLSLAAALLLACASTHVDANALQLKTAPRGLAAIAEVASAQIALASLEAIKEKVAAACECASGVSSYLYANANPTMYTDPSGYMSLVELNIGQSIQSGMRGATPTASQGALNIARHAKIFDVYTYAMWPLHFYMYVERIGSMAGARYDVGARGGWDDLLPQICQGNLCGRMPGGYVSASSATRASLKGVKKKVASFTLAQRLLWHAAVMGTEEDYCALDYSLIPGPNCLSWTIGGTIKAVTISRMKL